MIKISIKNTKKISLLSLILIGLFLFAFVPQTYAAPADNFKLEVGDWWSATCTHSEDDDTDFFNKSDRIKTVITEINYTKFGDLYETVWAEIYLWNHTSLNWSLDGETDLGKYNSTNYKFQMDEFLMIYSLLTSCNNQTAFYSFLNASFLGGDFNVSSKNGLTYTYWQGSADGNGGNTDSRKFIIILDTNKYIQSSFTMYNWTGSEWNKTYEISMDQNSWTTTTNPIPGFQLAILISVLSLSWMIIIIIKLRKNRLNIKTN